MSATARDGFPLLFKEPLATAGLVGVILATVRRGADVVAGVVGIYIALAIWSTSSTCFANPAVTITRLLTDIMTGIAPASVPGFVIAQRIGGAIGACFFWMAADGKGRNTRGPAGRRLADSRPAAAFLARLAASAAGEGRRTRAAAAALWAIRFRAIVRVQPDAGSTGWAPERGGIVAEAQAIQQRHPAVKGALDGGKA